MKHHMLAVAANKGPQGLWNIFMGFFLRFSVGQKQDLSSIWTRKAANWME
jgi:hypothetical protein